MTNRKLHTQFQFDLDDLDHPLPTHLRGKVFFGAHHENLNEGRPELLAAKV